MGRLHCVVPENIHTSPTEGIGNSREEAQGSQRPQNLKQCMKVKLIGISSRVGSLGQILSVGGDGYFLEPHIFTIFCSQIG